MYSLKQDGNPIERSNGFDTRISVFYRSNDPVAGPGLREKSFNWPKEYENQCFDVLSEYVYVEVEDYLLFRRK